MKSGYIKTILLFGNIVVNRSVESGGITENNALWKTLMS